ncbi:MAG: EAL domain-containing protein [Acidobacteria bacterium]|nr:EAL domain-containing protein [Acidobacteriota bacterium]
MSFPSPILIIDDDPDDLALTHLLLRDPFSSAEIKDIAGAADFSRALVEELPRLIVTELELSWIAAPDLVQTVQESFEAVPIVLFSRPGNESLAILALQAGADSFVPKTSRGYLDLPDAVKAALFRSRRRQQRGASDSSYRHLVGALPLGVFTATNDGQILDANPALATILGFRSAETMAGHMLAELFVDQDEAERWRMHIQGSRAGAEDEVALRRHDGKTVWVRLSTWLVRQGGPEPGYLQGIIEDISEQKRIHQELVRRNTMLAESCSELEHFASIVSHDLREPLHLVERYTTMLAERYGSKLDAKAGEYMDHIVHGAGRGMIDAILELSRVETRGGTFAPVDFEGVLAEATANLEQAIAETSAAITHDLLPTLAADETQMMQLFQNLVGNALKFHGDEAPAIHVGAEERTNDWLFSVRDNGIGIKPEAASDLRDFSASPHSRGVSRHGDRPDLVPTNRATAPGTHLVRVGSRPRHNILLYDSKAYRAMAMTRAQPFGGIMPDPTLIRVMLVEDSSGEADLVREMLTQARTMRFDIEHQARLAGALARLQPEAFDIVLLDLNLPDSRGLETFDRVNAHCPSVPVIVLTNQTDEEMASDAVRRGAQDYLLKQDTEAPLLVRAIRYALERKAAEKAIRDSEQRYALAIRGANDGIWDWDLVHSTIFFSPRWKWMIGAGPDELTNQPEEWLDRVHPSDREVLEAAIQAHIDGRTPHLEAEYRLRHADGAYRWMLVRGLAVRGPDGAAIRMAGSQTDITARKKAEAQLLHDAFHDGLTGLANRALFLDRLQLALEATRRKKNGQFAVLFLDLDRFKNINDSFGHAVGDALLTLISERLSTFLRPGDTLARLGGDEFAILINNVNDPSDAVHVAERVHALLNERFLVRGNEIFISTSIGIALTTTGYARAEDVLRDADISMYRAKAGGGNGTQIFDRKMHDAAVALLKLEMDLRRSVERGDFIMYYQPIVSLAGGRLVGFEGLVRWCHPERGLVAPEQFIGVAEETGLIVPLGWWVLEESCRQLEVWQRRFPGDPPLSISVNVSGKLFRQRNMVDRMIGILEHTHLDPSALRLEITENILMDHGEAALQKLTELRALGIQLQVDDFGTGYSSLSYLQRFHYDTLKIDRSFIAEMTSSVDADAIIETILGLANLLGMNVIAEGVETIQQFQLLRGMRCPQGQGFLFSHPVPPEGAEDLIKSMPER